MNTLYRVHLIGGINLKNIKLIAIVILLIVANLYTLVNIAFDIKYRSLIENYNQLSAQYDELEEKYITQGEKLQEVMSMHSDDKKSIKNRSYRSLNIDNISFKNIAGKLDKEIRWILSALDLNIFK